MNRKEFIRNISLAGVGISLVPAQLLASQHASSVRLPKAVFHVPHGNFANAIIERVQIPEMDVEVSVQHFMRNGIEATEKDISVFTFYREKETLNVCFDNEGCHFSGEINDLEACKKHDRFLIKNAQFEVELKKDSTYLSLRRKA
ncbi:MAG: hypothetical protein GC178_10380 [Flavobacteriales bacterium]|nr:hypothetical protein [Flavobacteriales bacterium]